MQAGRITKLGWMLIAAALTASAWAGCSATDADRRALAQGYAQYQSRNFDQAEAAANVYLTKYPSAPNVDEAYYLRGLARLGRGDSGGASQDLHAAIGKSRRNDLRAKAWRALGDIAFDATRWAEAQQDFQQALTLPGQPAADLAYLNYRIGEALQNQGQWDRAKPSLDKAAADGDATIAPRARERAESRYFTLQFGAFRDLANATTLARNLKGAGMTAGVFPVTHDAQTIYAVRAGGYATWAAADAARSAVQAKYPLVTVYP